MINNQNYYCKIFVNKDIDHRELEILIEEFKSKNEKGTNIAAWGEIDVILNKAAKPPWGMVDDDNFLYWKFFLDLEPIEGIARDEYVKGIIKLMHDLRNNGFQVIAACDFEDELPKFEDKDRRK
ncbi:MAG: 1,4-dihydroxy-6-naphthoate synthase [Bacteroidota bacterium]|nr:1,4-dihydroxy-6-naphthoate synthase [Bacteroidota bacterium]